MNTLSDYRSSLKKYFKERATENDVKISPRNDTQQLDLLDRLHEEYIHNRGIIIELDLKGSQKLDYFFKETERDEKAIEILYIVTAAPESDKAMLWAMYISWMQNGWSRSLLEETYPKSSSSGRGFR